MLHTCRKSVYVMLLAAPLLNGIILRFRALIYRALIWRDHIPPITRLNPLNNKIMRWKRNEQLFRSISRPMFQEVVTQSLPHPFLHCQECIHSFIRVDKLVFLWNHTLVILRLYFWKFEFDLKGGSKWFVLKHILGAFL